MHEVEAEEISGPLSPRCKIEHGMRWVKQEGEKLRM
jgi:hypothetical protein